RPITCCPATSSSAGGCSPTRWTWRTTAPPSPCSRTRQRWRGCTNGATTGPTYWRRSLPAFPPNLPEQLARHLLRSFPPEEVRAPARRASKDPGASPTAPVGYAQHILGVRLTPDQETILRHLLIPPCVVNVPSGNNTGKTFLAAVGASWWYDSFNPGVVYTTAPRHEHVVNVLWGQLRLLRGAARVPLAGFIGPRAPQMYDGP